MNSDLATANFATDTVSVLLGDGSGSFASTGDFDAGTAPLSLRVGDFNGDSDLDLGHQPELQQRLRATWQRWRVARRRG